MKLDSRMSPQVATYIRYNVLLERDGLKSELGLELTPAKVEQLRKMDDPANLSDFAEIGHLTAAKQIRPEHLPGRRRRSPDVSIRTKRSGSHAEHGPETTPKVATNDMALASTAS